jgi:hypothetical protein
MVAPSHDAWPYRHTSSAIGVDVAIVDHGCQSMAFAAGKQRPLTEPRERAASAVFRGLRQSR